MHTHRKLIAEHFIFTKRDSLKEKCLNGTNENRKEEDDTMFWKPISTQPI